MLRLAELEALASSYRRDVAGRLAAPRAAEVRDRLARGCRDLAQVAGALGDFTRHELALVGTTAAEARKVGELLESWSAKSGAAACEVDALGLNGRRRWTDYREPPPKFSLVRRIADRLDELGVPIGGYDTGALYDHAHEVLYLAGEVDPSRGLNKVVADVLSARKNRQDESGVQFLAIAAE